MGAAGRTSSSSGVGWMSMLPRVGQSLGQERGHFVVAGTDHVECEPRYYRLCFNDLFITV